MNKTHINKIFQSTCIYIHIATWETIKTQFLNNAIREDYQTKNVKAEKKGSKEM